MSLYQRLIKKTLRENAIPFTGDRCGLSWRKKILREFGEWAPIETSGPANSTSTTFGYFIGGSPVINGETGQQVTFTYSGLQGVENYPTSVTIDQGFGDTFQTDPPPFSQLGVQGYTAKLNPRYKEAQEKYKKEYDEFEEKRDANFQAIKDTLKSFGTSWEEMRASKEWVKKLSDGTVVSIVPTSSNPSPMDWTNNVKVVKLKQCTNASGPMTINYNPPGQYLDWVVENAEIQNEVYLEIGEPPKPPMESEYLMPRRTDYRDVNPLLDASQEFAQQVGADYMMNARVQDAPEQPSFFDYDPFTGEPLDFDRVVQNPQLYSRLFRSLTDNIRYGGGSIVTGLPSGITYDPNYRSSMKLQRWFKPRNYGAPLGTFNPGELNVSRMYMEPAGSPTRGTLFGNKSGAYWVQDAPKKGLPGIKNPFASTVNRGWSGTPEVQIPQGGPRAVQASADDVAKLASKGAKTSKVLSRLVPGVAIVAAVADVGTRIAEGDYTGAVLGAVSAIPGPIGWLGFGAQMLYDVTGAKQTMPYNRLEEEVSDEQWKPKVMEYLNSLDKDEYIRTLAAMLLHEGINPELVSLTVRSFYKAELEDSEIKFIETSLPKLIKIFQQDKTNPKLPKRTKKVSPQLRNKLRNKKKQNESTVWDRIKKHLKGD